MAILVLTQADMIRPTGVSVLGKETTEEFRCWTLRWHLNYWWWTPISRRRTTTWWPLRVAP